MGDGRATVFMSFHRSGEPSAFTAFARQVGADAASAPGFVGWQLSVLTSPLLEWAIAVTFRDEPTLQEWLDGAAAVIAQHPRASVELFVSGIPFTPGVLLVRDVAEAGHEDAFIETAERLARLERVRPGYEGSSVFEPVDHNPTWSSVIRFRTQDQLDAWLASPELSGAIPERHAQLSADSQITTASSFGSTVRVTDGHAAVTPAWKTTMTILLVLYPLVVVLSLYVNPWLAVIAPAPWLSLFLSLAITMALVTWVLLPLVMRMLRRWLDPAATSRVTALGAVAVCGGYALLMLVFATVPFLRL